MKKTIRKFYAILKHMMHIPRVAFKTAPLDLEIDMFFHFLYQSNGWEKYLFRLYPKLRDIRKNIPESEGEKAVASFLRRAKIDKTKAFTDAKQRFRSAWTPIEQAYLREISSIMEIPYPTKRKTVCAYVGLNPICPRFLHDWSFSIYFNETKPSRIREIIAHEICHFLWFEKWKRVFPKSDPKTFEAPHDIWLFSELAAPIILIDARIRPLIGQKASFYAEHRRLKLGNVSAPVALTRLYRKRKNIEKFMKEGLTMIQRGAIR